VGGCGLGSASVALGGGDLAIDGGRIAVGANVVAVERCGLSAESRLDSAQRGLGLGQPLAFARRPESGGFVVPALAFVQMLLALIVALLAQVGDALAPIRGRVAAIGGLVAQLGKRGETFRGGRAFGRALAAGLLAGAVAEPLRATSPGAMLLGARVCHGETLPPVLGVGFGELPGPSPCRPQGANPRPEPGVLRTTAVTVRSS
jgi:hypothetical protein